MLKTYLTNFSRQIVFLTLLFLSCLFSAFSYEVEFTGVEDEITLNLIKTVSQSEKLKDSPPSTMNGLKRRADNDIPNLIQALHSLAYYSAKIDTVIKDNGLLIIFKIDLGSIYPLSTFKINYFNGTEPANPSTFTPLSLSDITIDLGTPALPETILSAEDTLQDLLNQQGFAFVTIKKRKVLVDEVKKTVDVVIDVDIGPLTQFGPTKIDGLDRVKESYIKEKLKWTEGERYNPHKIEKTQEALELSGLFRSVNISIAEQPLDGHLLPIDIQLIEGKQRSIGLGINYMTELGPGITAEWEDRNIFGTGQKLGFKSNLWKKLQNATVSYIIPNFRQSNQNLLWQMDYNHEETKAFTETAFSLSGRIEKKINKHLSISYGAMYKFIHSAKSEHNGTFDLIKTPLQIRWSNADSLLDPTEGVSFNLKIVPSLQFIDPQFAYSINTFTVNYYIPLDKEKKTIFANKLTLGSIFGASKNDIPPPERFYAGSENTIRGYRYLTISPLEHGNKPVGGRSMFIYSLELRHRFNKNFGAVLFYDMGNVYSRPYPNFDETLRQSAGIGIRYHTPVAPLRFDIAVPLNRRKHIDHSVEAYFSIGQSF